MIQLNDIWKSYIQHPIKTQVLKGINLSVHRGDFVSILGPSGSGKTTLLNIIGCLEPFDQGSLLLMDQELSQASDQKLTTFRAQHIGFIFQDFHLINHLTVEENIMLAKVLAKKNKTLPIDQLLSDVGMLPHKKKYPYQLSGGEKQRVAIARAMVNLPDLILADEPTGNLDHKNTLSIMNILSNLHKNYQTTILMVTHNEEITSFSNRILRMLDGVIISDEKTD